MPLLQEPLVSRLHNSGPGLDPSTRLPDSLLWELPGPLCTELSPFRNLTPGEHQSFLALTPALSRSTKIRLIFQNSLLSLQLLSLLQRRNLTSIQSSPKMIHFVRDMEQLDAPREYYYPLSNAFAGCRSSRSAPPHSAVEVLSSSAVVLRFSCTDVHVQDLPLTTPFRRATSRLNCGGRLHKNQRLDIQKSPI